MENTEIASAAEVAAIAQEEARRIEFEEREQGVVRDPRTMRIIKGALWGPNTSVNVKFVMQRERNAAKTAIARRNGIKEDQYDDVEWIYKSVPGRKDDVNRPVTDSDIWEFPIEYALFKKGFAAPSNGTPLEKWNQMTAADIAELARYGIHTVEAVAGMSDGNASGLRGFQMLKARAQVFLEQNTKQNAFKEIDDLKAQLAEVMTLLKKQDKKGTAVDK